MAVQRRASKDLQKYLKAGNRGRLLPAVERHILAREPEFRGWRHLHPSHISHKGWCVRAAWYVVTSDTPPPKESIHLQKQNIFDEGHYIHDKWQTRFWEMGALFGNWRCQVCHHEWWATSPHFCAEIRCQSTLLKYAEVPLTCDDWLISGHADGWIKGIGPDALIEIKSMSAGTFRMEAPRIFEQYDGDFEQMWKNLKRPFASHVNQAQLYLRVLHASREDAPNEAVFIYESKVNQQIKEFVVPYSERHTDEIIDKARIVKKHVESGRPPRCETAGGCSECRPYREKEQ